MTAEDDLTCREAIAALPDAFAGDLPAQAAAAFDRHVAACPACRSFVHQYCETIHAARCACAAFGAADLPDTCVDVVLAVIRARRH
ncbi:MAG: zf-HC2 domain-containing protein [Vicinamibacterales bacterium]